MKSGYFKPQVDVKILTKKIINDIDVQGVKVQLVDLNKYSSNIDKINVYKKSPNDKKLYLPLKQKDAFGMHQQAILDHN